MLLTSLFRRTSKKWFVEKDFNYITSNLYDQKRLFDGLYMNLDFKKKEYFWVLLFNNEKSLLKAIPLFTGEINYVLLRTREIKKLLISEKETSSVLFSHNHPSGFQSATYNDLRGNIILETIVKNCGIEFLDHIIYTEQGIFSFKKANLLSD